MLQFIRGEGLRSGALEAARVELWYRRRLQSIVTGELGLIVHQMDVLAVRR